MTESELKSKLQLKYDFATWRDLLKQFFPHVNYLTHPNSLSENTDLAKSVRQIALLPLLNENKNIGIFEVQVANSIQIARNRVSLREIAAKYIDMDRINAAFVFYFHPNQNDYRFTFIVKKTSFSDEGDLVKYQTPPKRFTYVLGPNESCTTAAKRLLELVKVTPVTLEVIEQAFSLEKLNKEFFKKYKEHYDKFCDELSSSSYRKSIFNIPHFKDKKENSKAEKPIRDFVKLLLGRIVFLHFLQKKGWLGCPSNIEEWNNGDPNFLQNLFLNFKDKKHFYSSCLTELFFDTLNNNKRKNNIFNLTGTRVPYLNGGLFDNTHSEYNVIDFPKNLFEDLFDFFNQYNFTIDESSPDEHEVGIDPEMLGHIFENLLEDNKDKGAFYTPKEIVHYMCHESLIQYLKTNMSDRAESRSEELSNSIENFIHAQEVSQFIRDNAKDIDSLLTKVKICDPAIGSGAFPMGLLKEIFQAKLMLYPYLKTNRSFSPGVVKRNIIQNSIYGVDIDSGAIDIARLRFWLALIVDEEEPTPLPNLDYKIMQGNSLLESFEGINLNTSFEEEKFKVTLVNNQINMFTGDVVDPQYQVNFTNQQKLEIKELTETYFKETDKSEKHKIHRKIEAKVLDHIEMNLELYKNRKTIELVELKNELKGKIEHISKLSNKKQYLNKNKTLKEIEKLREELKEIKKKYNSLKSLEETTERPYFLWHFYFKDVFDKGGFDIVIGNPPYLQLQKDSGKIANLLQDAGYKTFERTGDIYSLFYELGFDILKQNGVLIYISSSQWMKAGYGKSLRNYFLNVNPLKLILLGPGVFENAVVDTNILVAQNGGYKKQLHGYIFNTASQIAQIHSSETIPMPYVSTEPWAIMNPVKQSINDKLIRLGKALVNWDINIYRGVLTGYNEAFIIDEAKRNELVKADSKNKEIVRPVLRGREIDEYYTEWDGSYLIATFPSLQINISKYGAVKKYLEMFLPKLNQVGKTFTNKEGAKEKTRKETTHEWFETQDPISFYEEFQKEKVVWKRIGSQLRFTYSDEEIYCLDSTCIATGEKIKYLTALLNSKLCKYQLFEKAPKTGMGDLIISVQALEPLLVYYPDDREEKIIEKLVTKIIEKKKKGQETTSLENEIDIMVYKLYGLTYEEVKVIDPDIEQVISEKEYEKFVKET